MRFNQRRSLALVFAFAAFFVAGDAMAKKKSCDWFGKSNPPQEFASTAVFLAWRVKTQKNFS